ncbi:MAG: ABC transporter ATP-binding protein, partial [Lachnospiraceae bacterium]|nr:ABC transporter ATP-binding protein [Lachnospiraceae bacterium]
MLETLHLTKVYKTKGGADVKALDDVSIQFPEKGMVFLLGKSGSGKSTLLNVCGGLDSPTSGEIIVKGRSSQKFSQSDFDSYRNTFIGFIFQEYNILEEFTIEDNIALALELQGKPKDKIAIGALLEQVDLTGYAKRKPNTLSGGQKQRIAIARALIKSPEIIMADEPTGALDSATGKQVFDTLKKLSKDKLVIVVSHDRDFAEQYADRIIELKDGKIISDVTKTQEKQQAITEHMSIVGDTLCIKKGTELTQQDFEEI